jgi:hypothetical protein
VCDLTIENNQMKLKRKDIYDSEELVDMQVM